MKKVLAGGKTCANKRCNLRMGTHEEAAEFEGKIYHTKCFPLRPAVLHCHVGRIYAIQ